MPLAYLGTHNIPPSVFHFGNVTVNYGNLPD